MSTFAEMTKQYFLTHFSKGDKSPGVKKIVRGVAQSGSALVWGTSGRWFKSSRPDQIIQRLSRIS